MNIEVNSGIPRREDRARVFAALGDPTRLGIVELLQVQDLSPDALASSLEVSGNLLAHHVRVLEEAGLVRRIPSKNDRRRMYVQLVPASLEVLQSTTLPLEVPRVVFVCTHNSARSVLADAIWPKFSSVPSTSAGTHPGPRINPGARAAARRHGCSIRQTSPQHVEEVLTPSDLIVSVCDSVNEELGDLVNPHIHWSIPDPAAIGTKEAFDDAVRDLTARIAHLSHNVQLQSTGGKK